MPPKNIEHALKHAAEMIGRGLISSEAQVAQAVILPTLNALDWDYANPEECLPQYPVSGYSEGRGWVDFALLWKGAPLVFIEAKRLGGLGIAGESQLFNYANRQGIPLLVLTDGDTWDFYLSMAAGIPSERRFYRAELRRQENFLELARHFDSYLRKDQVTSGKARRAAEEFHASQQGKVTAKNAIPEVWQSLLQDPDDMLRDLLVEAVESKCGTKPDLDDAEEFLGRQAERLSASPTSTRAASSIPPPTASTFLHPKRSDGAKRIVGYTLNGKNFEIGVGNRTLAEVLKTFQRRDANFMPKYAAVTIGRTRRLVAQNRDDLYNVKDLLDFSVELEDGWWLGTNLSNVDVKKRIRIACEVIGIRFGEDLKLIER